MCETPTSLQGLGGFRRTVWRQFESTLRRQFAKAPC